MRSRTARVMTTLMRNGRDRRSGKPVLGHAILERVFLVGTRSADHIRASGHCGCIATEVILHATIRPDTWLHPNASLIVRFPLHRGRGPYMAHRAISELALNGRFRGEADVDCDHRTGDLAGTASGLNKCKVSDLVRPCQPLAIQNKVFPACPQRETGCG